MSPADGSFADELAVTLGMRLRPVGFRYAQEKPAGALAFKGSGGCLASMIYACARGASAALGPGTCGRPCAAFYLGFAPWIFDGIEQFLSCGPCLGREPERFIRTPELVRQWLEATRISAPAGYLAVFKPFGSFAAEERPEVTILFATPDQLSALVFLLHFDNPMAEQRVVGRFASACGSMVTLPLRSLREGKPAAFWGFHDPSARVHLPAALTTLAMPTTLLEEAWSHARDSFLATAAWARLRDRAERRLDTGSARLGPDGASPASRP
jgi:hypothetical protein